MKYGKSAKVLTFPPATQKQIVSVSLNDTITERSPNHKESKEHWPTILGICIGIGYVLLLFAL